MAAVHALATTVLIVITFGTSMAQFDGRYEPSPVDRALSLLLDVLSWPVLWPLLHWGRPGWFPGLLGYIPIVLNSLVWGMAAAALLRMWPRRDPIGSRDS